MRFLLPILPAILLSVLFPASAWTARITLVYGAAPDDDTPKAVCFASNWNPENGAIDSSWGGFMRRPMYDDGTHGDSTAGDGIWSVATNVQPAPDATFEWAVDLDSDPTNGWIGTGTSFNVTSEDPQTIHFTAPLAEDGLSRPELEKKFGLDLSVASAPKPMDGGRAIAFTVKAPDAKAVYIAGSFNSWANNDNGVIVGPQYRMTPVGDGIWLRILELPLGTIRYKFAMRRNDGTFTWIADPNVTGRDPDGNTVLDLRSLLPDQFITSVPGRPLRAYVPLKWVPASGATFRDVHLARTWIRPHESHGVVFTLADAPPTQGTMLTLRTTRDEVTWQTRTVMLHDQVTTCTLAADGIEAPILVEALLGNPDAASDRRVLVLPVVGAPADDLRYGFFATWHRMADDYAKKTAMLADLLINGVEYYDYFPAHGKYAPTEEVYEFEPFFGRSILVRDIEQKISSGHARGILAIAYVAAYAASKSIFDAHPYPMTNADGEPLLFNGRILTEKEADAKAERKWFWLMAIARDTPWHAYILNEWRRTLTDEPGDRVDFDGLEIDSYGHDENTKYYSKGSSHSGRPLAEVIAELIEDAWRMAHRVKPGAAVSFNCVNEFGIERMYSMTDFLFVENWSGHKAGIEETVDICYRHRAAANQRVVLKMYPADAGFRDPDYFPAENLRLMLGICITGGGSLMIAGDPDERTGEMHALNSLYYPDNVAIPDENVAIIRAYNEFDAMLYGLNHGRMVTNRTGRLYIPGCVVREFTNNRDDVTVMLLNPGNISTWNERREPPTPLLNQEVAIDVPAGIRIEAALYVSPDSDEFRIPVLLDFEQKDRFVRVRIPRLDTLGALILKSAGQ